jgi:hypothetical protein
MTISQKISKSACSAMIIATMFTSSFADYALSADSQRTGNMSVAEFAKSLDNLVQGTEGEDCQLQVTKAEGGLVLSMKNDDVVTLVHVSKDAIIKFKTNELFDGSYQTLYTIPGQGSVEETYADDMYYHTNVKNIVTGQTAVCDVDF